MNIDLSPIIRAADLTNKPRKGDYVNPQDGLLYCGSCKTPKQDHIELLGVKKIVGCQCKCAIERDNMERLKIKEREEMERINRLRVNGIQDKSAQDYTFANANNTPILEKCQRYVGKWDQALRENSGLIFWGNTGNGKTFAACCIANALIDQGVPVMVTSFPRLLAAMTGNFMGNRLEFLDSLSQFKLLVIDDLGAERSSSFALEQVYSVIDTRYKSGLPLIITTNLTLEEMKNPPNMDYQRIYDRVLEMCSPLHFTGVSFRKETAAEKMQIARRLLEG